MRDHDSDHCSKPYDRFEEERFTANPTVYWKARRFKLLDCGYCPPHRTENQHGRIPRYDRYKSVRKGRCGGDVNPPAREKHLKSWYRRDQNQEAPVKLYFRKEDRRRPWFWQYREYADD